MGTPVPVLLPDVCSRCGNIQPFTRYCKKCRFCVELTCGRTLCWCLPKCPTALDDFFCELCKKLHPREYRNYQRRVIAGLTIEQRRQATQLPLDTTGRFWWYCGGTFEDHLKETKPDDRVDGAGPSHEYHEPEGRSPTPTPEDEEVAMYTRKGERMRERIALGVFDSSDDYSPVVSELEEDPNVEIVGRIVNGAGKIRKPIAIIPRTYYLRCRPTRQYNPLSSDSSDEENDFKTQRKQPPKRKMLISSRIVSKKKK